MGDLHAALKTTIIQEASVPGLQFKHVRLQNGKDDFLDTLHVHPNSWTTSGLQSSDLLNFAGFRRSPCAFFRSECFAKAIPESFDVDGFAQSAVKALKHLQEGERHLENCGIVIPQPEGWGTGTRRSSSREYVKGDGHVAPKANRLKESEDEFFRFVLSWVEGGGAKGWTTHYRAKHMPLSAEFAAAMDFLGVFSTFRECPEFDFEMCWWQFISFHEDGRGPFGRNTEYVHRYYEAHAAHFSLGLKSILAAHVELNRHGLSFLMPSSSAAPPVGSIPPRKSAPASQPKKVEDLDQFDVALSFAGTEREHARQLAETLRSSGFKVFYDDFYPEQLWGRDLVALFDRIYRKSSKYCVIFVSAEYAKRIWTSHERRSAQARALEEKGREYILPIRFDETDLDGLPPTVGYLPVDQYTIEQIAELLIKKLRG
ncbi:MAG: TIR domain-containing protein [Desulfobacteraceae bacterium]|nr:MAG: TIR domain-containing protein [Desulfobacteraceae bacterium]